MSILDELSDFAKERVANAKINAPLSLVKSKALDLPMGEFEFENALKGEGLSFICECKKASPSKGIIAHDFPYLDIAGAYEEAGADCISVLTEPKWFHGADEYLKAIAASVKIPCIRKDFTVDEYMIYEAKLLGAKAVLLICSILSREQLLEYMEICRELGLSALVEAHDEKEIQMAVESGAALIGVNNRNLKDFSVDTGNSSRLKTLVPKGVLFVSESGVSGVEDVRKIKAMGADAALVGEALMRAKDKKALLEEFRNC